MTEDAKTAGPIVLDACCGPRMMWFDKQDPRAVFADSRDLETVLCDGRVLNIHPDVRADFRHLPFADGAFCHVVFDPPHLARGGDTSWLVQKYGKLPKDWAEYLRQGFDECWRVLKVGGTLVLKWSEVQIRASELTEALGRAPLYGERMHSGKTVWLVWVKTEAGT